ncbi:dystrophin-like [Sitodiplosis mosellana]|uniref:dystrophin-like n=1 Tax=Sitodiplosis mosellana TaxID=263140 RepID=UPI0024442138|nr:dystrophin-like [Sitodiplosis mosellana]
MAEKEDKPKVSVEVMKANQGIAAQAALRAQQMMFRQKLNSVSISSESATTSAQTALLKKVTPPTVPARGDSVLTKKPPEIPPKRSSLKKPIIDGSEELASKHPPPLPQKPNSAQNSPIAAPKLKEKPHALRPVPPTPQIPVKFDRPPANLPEATITSTNPFNNLRNSLQHIQRPNQQSGNTLPQIMKAPQGTTVSTTSSSSTTTTARQISPIEDFSSEDALRGIESGLRNMERAMQEQMNKQMNIRSMEAAAQTQNEKRIFNPMEFKRHIGGSVNSLDGSGSTVPTTSTQNMSVIESMRLALNKNMRSMERGFSMDQMRLDQMHLNNSMRNFEANAGNANGGQKPFENHMKSLDRNLPLELQYSRHNRSQSQQEMVDQMRQNMPNPLTGPTTLSRDDIRLRRRSSHDENQMTQTQNNNPVNRLREHWDETSQSVLQRKSQLSNMLGDSQRYETKRAEIDKWLQRMEARLDQMGKIATTVDVLEAQQKEQKVNSFGLIYNQFIPKTYKMRTKNVAKSLSNYDQKSYQKYTEPYQKYF